MEGDATPPSVRTAWIAGAALAAAAAGLHALAHPAQVLGSLSDESLLVALARRVAFGDTFGADPWIERAAAVFSHVYSWLLAPFLRLTEDPVVALRVLALPVHAVFLAGSFRVVERAAGRAAGWTAAAALAAVPFLLGVLDPETSPTPFAAGSALPRDLVFAALPWVWIAHDSIPADWPRPRLLLFLGLGLLANVHPLTAVHVAGLLAIDLVLRAPGVSSVVDAAAGLAATVVGALPFVVQYARYPRTPGTVPREVLLWRVEGIGADTVTSWVARLELPLWLLFAWLAVTRGRRAGAAGPLARLAAVALALAAAGPAADALVPGFQADRLARVAVWALVALLVLGVRDALRARDAVGLGAASALAAIGVAGPAIVEAVRGVRRGPLEHLARAVEVRVSAAPSDGAVPALLPRRRQPGDPSRDEALGAAFVEICRAARAGSGPGARFLVPPEDFGAFRAYAGRGVVVTRKEGGFALSFLGGLGADWFDEYARAVAAYADRDPAARRALADSAAATFAILDTDVLAPVGWREIRREGPYRLFRTHVE